MVREMKQAAEALAAQTALCGIVLHPAGHTRSPAMHNAAFAHCGIDAAYRAFDVPPDALADAIATARALGIRQLAISLPHKETVIQLLDEVAANARAIAAVNTVTLHDGRLVGTNTDWVGAMRALERARDLRGADAVVLGAGGTARAVVYGLLERGARVTVLNRTPQRARALADDLGAAAAGPLDDLATTPHDVLVNTTSVGLRADVSPVPAAHLRAASTVMDAVYDPEETRLLRDAAAAGAETVSGKWMLVYQAAEQFRQWTGRDAPIDVMAHAFDAASRS
jgi:shikimate dehydrogenase